MPKSKKNIKPRKKKPPRIKIDLKKILKERQADKEKNLAFQWKSTNINEPVEAGIINVDIDKVSLSVSQRSEKTADSNYNIPFNDDNFDMKSSCSQRLHIISIEQNQARGNIHLSVLKRSNWWPMFKDFEDIFRNWSADIVSFTKTEPTVRHETKENQAIKCHNYELVLRYLCYCVLKKPNEYNGTDLLTLAKYCVNLYLYPGCRPVTNIVKKVFSNCVKTAEYKAELTSFIERFVQELFSFCSIEDLLKIVVDLFLPIDSPVMEKMYSYLAYALFQSLIGKKNDNGNLEFPTDINVWFVQDLVDKNYFRQNSVSSLYNVISLLEHVVVVFDLYKNEGKMNNMYDFLYALVRQNGVLNSQIYVNKLDQWRLRLFKLHLNGISKQYHYCE